MEKIRILYYFDSKSLEFRKIKKPKLNKLKMLMITLLLFCIGSLPISINVLRYTELKMENRVLKESYHEINSKVDESTIYFNDIFIRNDSIYREFLDLKDITPFIKNPHSGGVDKYKEFRGHSCSELIINSRQNIDVLLTKLRLARESYDLILDQTKEYAYKTNIPGISPIKVDYLLRENFSGFGMRMHPILHYMRMHYGVDLTADKGTGVYSTADGVVKIASHQAGGFGNYVEIEHNDGYKTLYAHLSVINVVKNQRLKEEK
jgi:hypothetical protein